MLIIRKHWIRSWVLVVLSIEGLGSLGILLCFECELVRLVGVEILLGYKTRSRGRHLDALFGFLIE